MDGRNTFVEIWKDVKGYEGIYQVSNKGKVKSLDRKIVSSDGKTHNYKGKILKPFLRKGYYSVNLRYSGTRKVCDVHRIMANSFIGCGKVVNHKDGNKLNNNLENIELVTQSENVRHYLRLGLKKNFNNQYTKQKNKETCRD